MVRFIHLLRYVSIYLFTYLSHFGSSTVAARVRAYRVAITRHISHVALAPAASPRKRARGPCAPMAPFMSAGARRLSALIVGVLVGPLAAVRSAAPRSPASLAAAKKLIESMGHLMRPPEEVKTVQEAREVRAMRETLTGVWKDVNPDYDSLPDIWRFDFREQEGSFACRVETKEYLGIEATDSLLLKPRYDKQGNFTGFEGVGKGPWVHKDVDEDEVMYRFWLNDAKQMRGEAAWRCNQGHTVCAVTLGGWRL